MTQEVLEFIRATQMTQGGGVRQRTSLRYTSGVKKRSLSQRQYGYRARLDCWSIVE